MAGLETWRATGGDLSKLHSVASIFVSRIDTQIDKAIDAKLADAAGETAQQLRDLRGQVAIANAKIAYQHYLELISSPRWQALAAVGATPQRLLWASTGAKDPAYSDVVYVETLIGPDTINTMPPKTMDAFRDHGRVTATLTEDIDGARAVLAQAERLGLDLNGVTDRLIDDGVRLFAEAFDQLLAAVADKRTRFLGDRLNRQSMVLPTDLTASVKTGLEQASSEGWARRIWAKDGSVWKSEDADQWLGWLDASKGEAVDFPALEAFQAEVKARGFTHVLLLGMGGSSLGPAVLAETFGPQAGHPHLLVLDSTDPGQIGRMEAQIDPANTLFIVSSKSGSTLEPEILRRYFFELAGKALGGPAGANFIAVTDPGSALEVTAKRDGFRRVFHGVPEIGGRYSVLSNFGMVPAAAMGLDLKALFEATGYMVRACGASAPPAANPGVHLGVVLGQAAKLGRDKLTFITSPGVEALGAWLEQLIAESTGKDGQGLIPIDAEPLGEPKVYGRDRLFAYLRLDGQDDPERDAAVRALEEAGHGVVRIILQSPTNLFQEFFRWEMATAVAGAIIGIDPFNQPDVEESKTKTRSLTSTYEATGELDIPEPLLRHDGFNLHVDPATAAVAAGASTIEAAFAALLSKVGAGDYVALLAYLDRTPGHRDLLQKVRARIRDHAKCATALEFGPRFLHSTGQAYKGGPNTGRFLQLTAAPAHDLSVPGHAYSFGVVQYAQALGDFDVLVERGRRILWVHMEHGTETGLPRFVDAIERALG
jgi:transaldolase/glucose-6-phosphate isomerase